MSSTRTCCGCRAATCTTSSASRPGSTRTTPAPSVASSCRPTTPITRPGASAARATQHARPRHQQRRRHHPRRPLRRCHPHRSACTSQCSQHTVIAARTHSRLTRHDCVVFLFFCFVSLFGLYKRGEESNRLASSVLPAVCVCVSRVRGQHLAWRHGQRACAARGGHPCATCVAAYSRAWLTDLGARQRPVESLDEAATHALITADTSEAVGAALRPVFAELGIAGEGLFEVRTCGMASQTYSV